MIRPSSIVVINDDRFHLRLIERVLRGVGYEVVTFLDPLEALTEMRFAPGARLVVVDLHMPRIDGWKVCSLLRSEEFRAFNKVGVLVVSATFSGADVEAITASVGADAFLAAPFRAEDLLSVVGDLISGAAPKKMLRALMVEDDEDSALLMSTAFARGGYEVHVASTLAEAEAIWKQFAPDVATLDVHLPDGSCEALLRARSADDRAVTLVITGDPDPTLPMRLIELGVDRYVRKPIDPTALVAIAAQARRERSLLRAEAILELRTRQLRSSEARYTSLFHTIPDMVFLLDSEGRISDANRAAADRLGVERVQLLGRPVSDILDTANGGPAYERVFEAVRSRGSPSQFECRVRVPGESALPADVVAAFHESPEGDGMVFVARDATARIRSQEEQSRSAAQSHRSQRLESLGMLSGSIAHDFNNLLVGILGNADLGLLEAGDGPTRECLENIHTAARHAADLANQILKFSGRSKREEGAVQLTSLVEEMGVLLKRVVSPTSKVSYRLAKELPSVEGDRSELGQVAMNLIMNASDALMGRPGTIEVETDVVESFPTASERAWLGAPPRDGPYVTLSVRDDGCGIDSEALSHMFEPFFTTKPNGRGFGLATTLGVVRGHGGFLTVESEVGVGTEVRIYLPVAPMPAVGSRDGDASDARVRQGARDASLGNGSREFPSASA